MSQELAKSENEADYCYSAMKCEVMVLMCLLHNCLVFSVSTPLGHHGGAMVSIVASQQEHSFLGSHRTMRAELFS